MQSSAHDLLWRNVVFQSDYRLKEFYTGQCDQAHTGCFGKVLSQSYYHFKELSTG